MPETIIRRCPKCGRKAHDSLLVQCPDCRVPFVYEHQTYGGLTQEQLQFVAGQIFGSWKFWTFLLIIVAAASWGIVIVADRLIDARAKQYLASLEQNTTNHLGAAFGQISNQIAAEFKQPRIQSAIERAARARANEIFSNGVRPSIEAFNDSLDSLTAQLSRSSNTIAKLEADALDAEHRIPPPAVVSTNPEPIIPAAPVPPQTNDAPVSVAQNSSVKLVLVNHTVNQAGGTYLLTLLFRAVNPNGGPPAGVVDIMAGTYRQTARILSFASMTSGAAMTPTINATGDVAELKFAVSQTEPPTVVLELSGPTIVRVASDALDGDLTLPVAAERMQVPTAGK